MSQEIEIEYKNLLTKNEYEQLLSFFQTYRYTESTQVNHYFETKDFSLKKHGAALRVRLKNNMYIATLKEPNPNGPGLLETHEQISKETFNNWITNNIDLPKKILMQLSDINTKLLKYGGKLETIRMEIPYQDTLVVLDHSKYNNKEDYELELETTDADFGKKVFGEILAKFHIPKRDTKNKIQRFYDSI
ncbi:CYTH domain-containing protein [Gracilibacillus marinus]|uniref:CYTH domain-containing protein n=1 Tax=Gracilibacillus marinus TaxID=630535 RepID=A0ABV8VSZ1_9BACI